MLRSKDMSAIVKETRRGAFGAVSWLASEALRRDSLLFRVAVAHLLLIPLMMLAAPFDERLVTGLNPWVKPIKFALANAVYLRSEEHTSELQSRQYLVCRLLLEKKKKQHEHFLR